MKKTGTVALLSITLAACVAAYQWRSDLGPIPSTANDGPYWEADADIHRISDDRLVVAKLTPESLSFVEVNGTTGETVSVGQPLPNNSMRRLQLVWSDDTHYVTTNIARLAGGSLEAGLQWQLDDAQFEPFISQSLPGAVLKPNVSYQLTNTPHQSVVFSGVIENVNVQPTVEHSFIADIDRSGQIQFLRSDPLCGRADVVTTLESGFVVKCTGWIAPRTGPVVQHIDRSGNLAAEVSLPADTQLITATSSHLMLAQLSAAGVNLLIVNWEGEQLSEHSTSFTDSDLKTEQIDADYVMLKSLFYTEDMNLGYRFEKRGLDGTLVWQKEFTDFNVTGGGALFNALEGPTTESGFALLGDYQNSSLKSALPQVNLNPMCYPWCTGNGFSKTATSEYLVHNVFTGQSRVVSVSYAKVFYLASCESGSLCSWIGGDLTFNRFGNGVLRVLDTQLLENGSMVTISANVNSAPTPWNMVITRY